MKRWQKILFSILFGAFFLWLTFKGVDFKKLITIIDDINIGYLIIAMGVFILGVFTRAMRWRYFLITQKFIDTKTLFEGVSIAYAFNNILPFRLGEVIRAYVLSQKKDIKFVTSFTTVAYEKLFDGVALLILVLILSPFYLWEGWVKKVALLSGIVFSIVIVIGFLIIQEKEHLKGPLKGIYIIIEKIGGKHFESLQQGLSFMGSKKYLTIALSLSILSWFIEGVSFWFTGLSFGLSLPPLAFVLLMALSTLALIISYSPGHIGIFDFVTKKVFMFFYKNPDPNLATGYSLVVHYLVMYLPITIIGIILFIRIGVSINVKEILSKKEKMQNEG